MGGFPKIMTFEEFTKCLSACRREGKNLSARRADRIFKNTCSKAEITRKVSSHSLRYSFATHHLEGDIDLLRYTQELLGHTHSEMIEIYTYVSRKILEKMVSPIDKINFNRREGR